MEIIIRKATVNDAESITDIWKIISSERIYSAIDEPFSLEEEKQYLSGLSDREGVFLAIVDGKVVGFQTVDKWAKYANSFSHVGHIGTYIVPGYRGKGIADKLAVHNFNWARNNGYKKFVIYVRETNSLGIKFYKKLGFKQVGVLKKQVKIDNKYEDEIILEKFI
jgi:L-amino acid N-acyltransferase YncA